MARFLVAWTGRMTKTLSVETPSDALYWCWSRHRDDVLPGLVHVDVEEKSDVRLATVTFLARIAREIEAETPAEALRAFTFDDRLPSCFDAASIEVERLADPPGPEDTVS